MAQGRPGSGGHHSAPTAPRVQARLALARQLEASGLLADFADASDHLRSHLSGHALLLLEACVDPAPEIIFARLEEASCSGARLLSRKAEAYLLRLDPQRERRAGEGYPTDVEFGLSSWDEPRECWRSASEVLGHTWSLLDYRDKLPPFPDHGEALGLLDGAPEEKQCLCLHLAAAALCAGTGGAPTFPEVAAQARELRQTLWDGAVEALRNLG